MREHLIPSVIASIVATMAALGALHVSKPPQPPVMINAPVGSVNPAKAARQARTVWPELTQEQVDALTARLQILVKTDAFPVTIVCVDDAKCGDLALSLENALESAHWKVSSINSAMVPPGIISSSELLAEALKATTGLKVNLEKTNAGPGHYIAIGARQ